MDDNGAKIVEISSLKILGAAVLSFVVGVAATQNTHGTAIAELRQSVLELKFATERIARSVERLDEHRKPQNAKD